MSTSDAWEVAADIALPPMSARRSKGQTGLRAGLTVRPGDVPQLSALATRPDDVGRRARAVLLRGRGLATTEVAAALGVSRQSVHQWCARYAAEGIAGLPTRARAPRRAVDDRAVVAATAQPPPAGLGVSHWSARLLGASLGVGHGTVHRAWTGWGLRPHGLHTFVLATEPATTARVRDIVGLHVSREARLLALAVDPAAPSGGARHSTGPRPGTRSSLLAYVALRAALHDPGSHARRAARHELGRFLAGLSVLNGPGAAAVPSAASLTSSARSTAGRATLLVVGDVATLEALPGLVAWAHRTPRTVLRSVPGPTEWVRLLEVSAHLVEAPESVRGTTGAARDLADVVGALVTGSRALPGPFTWPTAGVRAARSHPAARAALSSPGSSPSPRRSR